jgi:hypothetical protein
MTNTLRDAIRMVNRKVILCGSAATLAMLASGVQAQEEKDRKSTRLNSSHFVGPSKSRMPSSA